MAERYSLRNPTRSLGKSFSLMVVKPSISEKKRIDFFSSPSKFIFPHSSSTSSAISEPTYSLSDCFNLCLFLSSIKYFTPLERV